MPSYLELRFPIPITIEEYNIGQLYVVAEESKNETGGGQGVIIKENKPGKHDGEDCQYTLKEMHLEKKVPRAISMLAPTGSLTMLEEAFNSYPKCLTKYKNLRYPEKIKASVKSIHLSDNGSTDRPHPVEDNLGSQEYYPVEIMDLADIETYPISDENEDVTKCEYLPLTKGYHKNPSDKMMCCYKLITIECNFWMVGGKIERVVIDNLKLQLMKFQRKVYTSYQKWKDLTMEDIRKIEEETKILLEEKIKSSSVVGTVTAPK